MTHLKIVLCGFAFAFLAWSQSDRGTITGTIADPAGAVVPIAAVEIRNVETGAVYQAGASAPGDYTLAQLPAGQYEVSVNVPGFKKFVRQDVAVEVAQCRSSKNRSLPITIPLLCYLRALLLPRHNLALEIAALRQQLAVFKRKQPRPPMLWTGCFGSFSAVSGPPGPAR
jgi:hypothetical protein